MMMMIVMILILTKMIPLSEGFTAVLLSSFTTVTCNDRFQNLFNEIVNRNKKKQNDNSEGIDNDLLVYIPTAKYYHNKASMKTYGEQRRRARYEAKDKCRILNSCFNRKDSYILELDDPQLTQQQIANIISKASVIYIDGGNTFYLQKYLIRCQFWNLVMPYLSSSCIYIGASAGGIVLGRSIETSYWKGWDDPSCAGDDIVWNTDTLSGANLIKDTSFFMHYDSSSHDDMLSRHRTALDHDLELISDDIALVYTTDSLPAEEVTDDESINIIPNPNEYAKTIVTTTTKSTTLITASSNNNDCSTEVKLHKYIFIAHA